jgi:hypothetical protein
VIVSADDAFYTPDGEYKHDASKLDEAHNECFRNFLRALVNDDVRYILVDNTNTLAADCAPYMRAASAFGWKARILRVVCDPKVALSRNDGRAPASVVEGQAGNLIHQRFPAYWTISTVKAEDVSNEPTITRLLRWPIK